MADRPDIEDRSDPTGRLIGFAIVAVAPTIFWSALLVLGAWAIDQPLSPITSIVVAVSIFSFLTCIWASFVASDSGAASRD